jgi:hypothetical protein
MADGRYVGETESVSYSVQRAGRPIKASELLTIYA